MTAQQQQRLSSQQNANKWDLIQLLKMNYFSIICRGGDAAQTAVDTKWAVGRRRTSGNFPELQKLQHRPLI